MSGSGTASIYVGDLADAVTEELLYQTFCGAGTILSVRLCREAVTGQSKKYGYVNFATPLDAQRAVDTLNHVVICGQPVRVMPSQRDAAARRSGIANVFVKNLHQDLVTNKVLHDHFSQFGPILSAKVAMDAARRSRGYGFVQFREPENAKRAIEALDSTEFCGQTLSVANFMPAKDRAAEPGKFFNVYVKNIVSVLDEEGLRAAFSHFGPITSTVVMCNSQGKSRGFGFVNFRNSDDAAKAVREMDGHIHEGHRWKVNGARRREDSSAKVQQQANLARTNLTIKHLSPNCTEAEIRTAFEEYGPIESIKVVKGPDGLGKGNAFLQFKNPEDAEAAITGLHGQKISDYQTPITVSLAPRRRPSQEAPQSAVPTTTTGLNQAGISQSAYNLPPVQPVLAHPNMTYYPGPQIFYGVPSLPLQQGQQQVAAAYVQMQAPATQQRHVYDQMSSLVGGSNTGLYLGQPSGAQLSSMHPMAPLMGMRNSSTPFVGYDTHIAGPQPHYWQDPGSNVMLESAGQDPSLRHQRSRFYQQRPLSPVQGSASHSLVTSWRRPGGGTFLPFEAQVLESTGSLQAVQPHARNYEQAQQLSQSRTRPQTTLSLQEGLSNLPVTTTRQSGADAVSLQSELLARTAGLFPSEATSQLLHEGSLQGVPPSTTSSFR